MKFYRFMSEREFIKMSAGCPMTNNNPHSNRRTASVGFCFLGEKTEDDNGNVYTPESCIEFLSGIVSSDILVEFEGNEDVLNESYGVYANPMTSDWDDFITIPEYCTCEYDREMLVPTRYAIPGKRYHEYEWYSFN